MDIDRQPCDDLIQEYLDGTLTAEAKAELERHLKDDRALARRFVSSVQMETLMHSMARQAAPVVGLQAGAARGRRRLWISAIAAGIAAAVAAGWWASGKWQPARNAAHPPATLSRSDCGQGSVAGGAASGEWQVAKVEDGAQCLVLNRQGGGREADVGDMVRAGETIETGEKGKVILTWGNRARVELGGGSILGMPPAGPIGPIRPIRPMARLETGRLTANVAPQLAGQPFVVETPDARVEVMGTRFSVRVEPPSARASTAPGRHRHRGTEEKEGEKSAIAIRHSAIPSTWLQVDEGRVKFTRLADEKAIELTAGQLAVAGEGMVLKPYAEGTTWVDGPVVFREDFESGAEKWQGFTVTNAWPECGPQTPRLEAKRIRCVRRIEVERNGKRNWCAAMRGRSARFSLKKPLPTGSYVIEWDRFLHPLTDDPISRENMGRWTRARMEKIVETDSEGRYILRTRVLVEGEPVPSGSSTRVVSDETGERCESGYLFPSVQCFVAIPYPICEFRADNIVIRKLAPIGGR